MAILTALSPVNMSYNGSSWWNDLPATSMSATALAFEYGFMSMSVNGNFTLTGGMPSGTITGMTLTDMGVTEATVTGLNVSVASYAAAFNPLATQQAQFDASQAVLFAGVDTANGSAGNDIILTYGGADVLYGNAGDDKLLGGAGNDLLYGGIGKDILDGGAGNDTLNGGAGFDVADYGSATAAVTANLGVAIAQNTGTSTGSDILTLIEGLQGGGLNDILTGNGAANYLAGGAGSDRLTGGAGNDILHGDAGADIIIGGAGRDGMMGGIGNDGVDTFKFLAASDSTVAAPDMINMFFAGVGGDKIDLSAIDAKTNAGTANDAFTYLGATNAFTAAGQVRMGADGLLYGNMDANLATSEFAINLNMSWNPAMVVAGNFIL